MMNKYIILVLSCLVLFQSLYGADKKVRLATCEWPPYVGKEMNHQGVTAAIVRQAFELEGYEVKIDFMPWSRVMKSVEAGEYDMGFPAYFSEERTKTFSYTKEMLFAPLYLCKLKDREIEYTDLESLKPYKIGVVNGYVNSPEFDKADFLNKKPANDDATNLKKLLGKRVDIISIDKLTAIHLSKTTVLGALGKLEFMGEPLQKKTVHLLKAKSLKAEFNLVADFESGLSKRKASEKYKGILKEFGL